METKKRAEEFKDKYGDKAIDVVNEFKDILWPIQSTDDSVIDFSHSEYWEEVIIHLKDLQNGKVKSLNYFVDNLWGDELNRHDGDGNILHTVTCTEDNLFNLYNSQFKDKTVYGSVYYYSPY